jgi:hypothetical protein
MNPVLAGILNLRGGHPHGVVHIIGRPEIFIDSGKIMEAVANGDNPGNLSLPGFLNYYKLLNRIFTD